MSIEFLQLLTTMMFFFVWLMITHFTVSPPAASF
jgi:hypothetical protein